jgi:hypothetical protein
METDAATVGTVLHATIEEELLQGFWANCSDVIAWACAEYVHTLEGYAEAGATYSMSTFGTHDKALQALASLVESWFVSDERKELLHEDEAARKVEWHFDLPFMEVEVKKHGKRPETIPVFLAGMADLVRTNRVQDWKSASSDYKQWEYQRWGRQPDVYCWAAAESGLIIPDRNGLFYFDFKVFVRRATPRLPDTITVARSVNHFDWLKVLVHRLVTMQYHLGFDIAWPTDDQHVLCSPKWCEFWSQCKGAIVDGQTWT